MINIKTKEEINLMREANKIASGVLNYLTEYIKEGISTYELDFLAEDYIKKNKAIPSFKGYKAYGCEPYPASICTSVNEVIVHGIPSKKILLKNGDIIGIDVGVYKNGFHGDTARTYAVGKISEKADKLLQVTKKSLEIGINEARVGNRIGDVSYAIGVYVKSKGYFVADDLTGHGIGRNLHEDPIVPNMGRKNYGELLREGMTIAIEPMVNLGTNKIFSSDWECKVADGSLSAHFEHTILITKANPEILTTS